jgi:hypothetical protein
MRVTIPKPNAREARDANRSRLSEPNSNTPFFWRKISGVAGGLFKDERFILLRTAPVSSGIGTCGEPARTLDESVPFSCGGFLSSNFWTNVRMLGASLAAFLASRIDFKCRQEGGMVGTYRWSR